MKSQTKRLTARPDPPKDSGHQADPIPGEGSTQEARRPGKDKRVGGGWLLPLLNVEKPALLQRVGFLLSDIGPPPKVGKKRVRNSTSGNPF